jgi:hypothetical protein
LSGPIRIEIAKAAQAARSCNEGNKLGYEGLQYFSVLGRDGGRFTCASASSACASSYIHASSKI